MLRRLPGFVVIACALAAPTSAMASAPLISTDGAQATGPATARIEGNADPNGEKTTLRAYYAPASSTWCTSAGAKGKASKTTPIKLGSGNVMLSEITVLLSGLAPDQNYCAELVAHNKSGTAHGGQRSFMTPSE